MATNAFGREEVRAYLRVTDLCEDVVCSAGEICEADYLTGKCTLYTILSYQLKLIKMCAKLANLNHCAVPFLSRAGANLCWYYYTLYTVQCILYVLQLL